MTGPWWINRKECLVIHEMGLARHGGLLGIRDDAALEAALVTPKERFAAGSVELHALATCYALALVRLRPFISGNGATAFLLAATFLRANRLLFTGNETSVAELTRGLARGEVTEKHYSKFLMCNTHAR
jgi:death-on-curing protein